MSKTTIPTNWSEAKIRNIGKVITGKTPSKDNPEHWGKDIPFVTPTDYKDDSKYLKNAQRFLSQEGVNALKNLLIPPKSIMVTCIGSDMGKVALSHTACLTNQQINSIIVDQNNYDVDFAYYALRNSYDLLKLHADGGSTMPILNKSTFEDLEILAPSSKEEQKMISAVLSCLDDKIELLKQQNNTLESIAQAMFKRWFIDFEFPNEKDEPYKSSGGRMVESELGKIPEGWKIGRLSDFIKVQHGYSFTSEEFVEKGYTIVRMGNFNINGGLCFDEGKTKYYFGDIDDKFVLTSGDLLVVMSDVTQEGSILGNPGIVPQDDNRYLLNQRVGKIYEINLLNKAFLYCLMKSRNYKKWVIKTANSTTVLNTSPDRIGELKIAITENKNVYAKFQYLWDAVFSKIACNILQVKELSKTRDLLLPKLMNGKVKVGL